MKISLSDRRVSGPLLTLLVGAVVAVVILVMNAQATGRALPDTANAAVSAAPAAVAGSAPATAAAATAAATATGGPATVPVTASAAAAGAAAPATIPVTASPAPPATDGDVPAIDWTYAGRVDDSVLTLAVRIVGDEAVAYLCDGAEYELWLRGTAVNGQLSLTGEQGQTLSGRFDADRVWGDVDGGWAAWTFDLPRSEWPDWAGTIPADEFGY